MKNFFFDIFAIHSSNRHEKHCQMSVRLFSLFQGSRNQQCDPPKPPPKSERDEDDIEA